MYVMNNPVVLLRTKHTTYFEKTWSTVSDKANVSANLQYIVENSYYET